MNVYIIINPIKENKKIGEIYILGYRRNFKFFFKKLKYPIKILFISFTKLIYYYTLDY